MPPPSKVLQLPAEVLAELDERLRSSQFSDYHDHEQWLRGLGHEIGKSAVHAYAQRNRAKIKARFLSAKVAGATGPLKRADQRIECLKVAAIIVPPDQVLATAATFFSWAYEE